MKKISSGMTFWYKRVLPVFFFGFIGFWCIGVVVSIFTVPENDASSLFLLIPAFLFGVFAYFMCKTMVFDLIDEVWDDGASLVFRNRNTEVRVSLADLQVVSYVVMARTPPRVTLSVRSTTELGKLLTFCPPISLIPFRKNSMILHLIDRIDEARGQRSAESDAATPNEGAESETE